MVILFIAHSVVINFILSVFVWLRFLWHLQLCVEWLINEFIRKEKERKRSRCYSRVGHGLYPSMDWIGLDWVR